MKNILSQNLNGKNILLLQGPVGPFFSWLAKALEENNNKVTKINFNAGDFLFFPNAEYNYRGKNEDWKNYLLKVIKYKKINLLFLFGQGRYYHEIAKDVSTKYKIELYIFEEGYLRPNFVTLEYLGVNNYSCMPKISSFYKKFTKNQEIGNFRKVGNVFPYIALYSFLYYTMSIFSPVLFPHYKHHRRYSFLELFPWVIALYRKIYYFLRDKKNLSLIEKESYFLVPLQVHNDAHLKSHSQFNSIEDFIQIVIKSFAKKANKKFSLVFKNHPLDRGYRNYSKLICHLSKLNNMEGRIYYIYDGDIDLVIKNAKGVVVVNSTTGLRAITHGIPVKTFGNPVYCLDGLCFRKSLDLFWNEAEKFRVNQKLLDGFLNYIISHNQINGSFYKRLFVEKANEGLFW